MICSKISVLIPTRQRLDRLRVMLESYVRTTGSAIDSELIFRVDEDDLPTQELLHGLLHGRNLVIGPRHNGYESMPLYFNEMLGISTGDVLMCGNDDMVFKTPYWASRILDVANQYPDGLFDFGVKTYNEDHYPFSIISKRVTERLGFIWDPRIFWGDIFLRDVMGAFERCIKLPSVEIDHDWVGHAPDQIFIEANQQDIFRRDPTYWVGTHAQAVNEAVTKLKELV